MPKLSITLGKKTVETELSKSPITAGRNEGLDLTLPVKEASREHFRLGRVKDGSWAIQDLGSTNGTLLNGEKITTAKLKDGDTITLGPDCTIVFLDPPPPKPKRTGPIVVKSRAQKWKEEQEAEAQRKREERRAARAAGGAAPAGAAPAAPSPEAAAPAAGEMSAEEAAQIEAETTAALGPDEVPPNAIEIDSEATLVRLLQQRDVFDRLLAQGERPVIFGGYTIVKRISEGGMGVVFRARHRRKKIDVALKLLRSEVVDEQNIARFKQEAWAISAFNHKNIVKVRDLSRHAGMHYIAMDFIDGSDLLGVGMRQELNFWESMEVIAKLAEVLRVVHKRNIWHRDIKPQNVLLDRNREIRLIDFGIATIEREHDDATKTAEGLIMGTPAFLSPEQAARGKMGAIDGRADLYSLGAVMYYLLTGRRPFTGKTAIEILQMNMTKPPPHPHTVEPMIPGGLVSICLRLLEKNPDDRYQGAAELETALEEWRKSKEGRFEADRHKKILKLRELKAKRQQQIQQQQAATPPPPA